MRRDLTSSARATILLVFRPGTAFFGMETTAFGLSGEITGGGPTVEGAAQPDTRIIMEKNSVMARVLLMVILLFTPVTFNGIKGGSDAPAVW
jgi:hypothetical protein